MSHLATVILNVSVVILLISTTSVTSAWAQSRQDKVAASGDVAPETGGETFTLFEQPSINNSGEVAFSGNIDVFSSSDRGIWTTTGGSLDLVAREGVGGVPGVAGADFFDFIIPLINDDGDVAFRGSMKMTGGVTVFDNDGIWVSDAGVLGLVVREGTTPAPGVPGDTLAPEFTDRIRLNNSGAISLAPDLRDGTLPDGNVVVTNVGGSLALVAQTGVVGGAPGVSASASFSSFSRTVLNDVGELAFQAGLVGLPSDENSGIWSTTAGTLGLVVQEGASAAGAGTAEFESFSAPDLNDSGTVAFIGELLPEGTVDATNDTGIWMGTSGGLSLVAREGIVGGVPDVPGASFTHFLDAPVLNNAGAIVFEQSMAGVAAGTSEGVWSSANGSVELRVRSGTTAVPGAAGALFGSFRHMSLNEGGVVAFESFLQTGTGGVTTANDLGIWVFGPDGDGLLVARELDTLDGKTIRRAEIVNSANNGGMSGGSDGRRRSLNENGQVAYRVEFSDNSQGVYVFTPDLHWVASSSGDWDTDTNWTFRIAPASVHDVFIDPSTSLTVTGPSADTSVRSLEIGGGIATATLSLASAVTLTATSGVSVEATGVLAGGGTVLAGVTNKGLVAPGSSPGLLTIDGTYTQTAAGRLATEIGGTTAGSEHDQLSISGAAAIDGILEVLPIVPYADPSTRGDHDTFVLLTAASRSGTFSTVEYDGDLLTADFSDGDSFRSHEGDGLFRNITYSGTTAELTNLLALAGDTDGDLDIDIFDILNINLGGFFANPTPDIGQDWTNGDFDDNQLVDIFDILAINLALATTGGLGGTYVTPGAAVPEPSALVLAMLGVCGLWMSGRRHGRRKC